MKTIFTSPYTYFIATIMILLSTLAIIVNRSAALAEKAPIDPGAISISKEIQASSDIYAEANKQIEAFTIKRDNAVMLAKAKDVELCIKYHLKYTRGSPGMLTETDSCPLN